MPLLAAARPHGRTARGARSRARRAGGQSLVEFALISVVLFFLILGTVEVARLMFVFSQITSAAQEGARWGMLHPVQVISTADDGGHTYAPVLHTNSPCNIVFQAKMHTTLISTDTAHLHVYVRYDGGADGVSQTYPIGQDATTAHFTPGTDRVVVEVVYSFHFAFGMMDKFAPGGINVRMIAARTILQDEPTPPPAPVTCSDSPPGP